MVAASFLDNYNAIVRTVRDQPSLIRTSSASGDANAGASTKAEAPQQAGQTLCPKIGNVKAYASAAKDAKVVASIPKGEELIASGEVKNGFVYVDAANFSGWVQRTLVGACGASVSAAPLPVTNTQPMSSGIFGTFAGSFAGPEQGTFNVVVTPGAGGMGVVSGGGVSNQTGAFSVSGTVAANGRMNMTASGSAGSAIYQGFLDGNTGAVSGTWHYAHRSTPSGSFGGQRQ